MVFLRSTFVNRAWQTWRFSVFQCLSDYIIPKIRQALTSFLGDWKIHTFPDCCSLRRSGTSSTRLFVWSWSFSVPWSVSSGPAPTISFVICGQPSAVRSLFLSACVGHRYWHGARDADLCDTLTLATVGNHWQRLATGLRLQDVDRVKLILIRIRLICQKYWYCYFCA
jgi:hypothetical protein